MASQFLSALLFALSCFASPPSFAQAYPSRPVRIAAPFAGGAAASPAVAKAPPDGYTLLLVSNANAVSTTLFRSQPVDAVADFAPISTIGFFDLVFFARPGAARQSMAAWIARARANPGKL